MTAWEHQKKGEPLGLPSVQHAANVYEYTVIIVN
jgi:hypothetical protein